MKLHPHQVYHIYNRGNNRKRLFYTQDNYQFFLAKIRKYISPHCDFLAYCLMPNHFHFLIHANERTILPYNYVEVDSKVRQNNTSIQMSRFSHGIQMLLSSYAKAINKRNKRTGSLFTQNTHTKMTSRGAHKMDYTLWCFIYIHNNPVTSGLVDSPEKWIYSSYQEYLGQSTDPLCNLKLGKKLLSLEINELIKFNDIEIPDQIIDRIF